MQHIDNKQVDGELKKGSAELLILALIEHRPRHGYEISKLIETRSEGILRFNVASLYPLLYRLEQRGLTAKLTGGSFGTERAFLMWGPAGMQTGTFAAVELYHTAGFGVNRSADRGHITAWPRANDDDVEGCVGHARLR